LTAKSIADAMRTRILSATQTAADVADGQDDVPEYGSAAWRDQVETRSRAVTAVRRGSYAPRALPSSISGSVLPSSSPSSSSVPDTADALANTVKSVETTKTQAAGTNAGTATPTNSSTWSCASSDGQTTIVGSGSTTPVATTTVSDNGSGVDEDKILFTMYVGFGAVGFLVVVIGSILFFHQKATRAKQGNRKRAADTVDRVVDSDEEEETVVAASARYGGPKTDALAPPPSHSPLSGHDVTLESYEDPAPSSSDLEEDSGTSSSSEVSSSEVSPKSSSASSASSASSVSSCGGESSLTSTSSNLASFYY